MFSKPNTPPPAPTLSPRHDPVAPAPSAPTQLAARQAKGASHISTDMTLEGNVSGGGELQVDGTIKGDVRIERVTIGETGFIEGGVFADAVEVRGKVTGSITAKQVRLYGACHVDGDITHEQLAMEIGAFFQGRSLRLQRPPTPAAIIPPTPRAVRNDEESREGALLASTAKPTP